MPVYRSPTVSRPPEGQMGVTDHDDAIAGVPIGQHGVPTDGRGRRKWMIIGTAIVVILAGASIGFVTTDPIGSGSRRAVSHAASPGTALQPGAPATTGAASRSPAVSQSPSAHPSLSQLPGAAASAASKKPAHVQPQPIVGSTIPVRANCGSDPGGCGLPDASNTGVPAGMKLTTQNGDLEVRTAGAVISNKNINGCITVLAAHVTIKDTKISCPGYYGILFDSSINASGLLIEDVEINCLDTNTTGVASHGLTARRLNIHGCENGFSIDNTSTVEDSYMHDFYQGATGHADGIQLEGGADITISHNTILDLVGTSAIISDPSQNSNVLVSANLMAGGSYTLYCPRDSSTNYRVIGNRFSRMYYPKGGQYGPWSDCNKVAVLTGNLWDNDLSTVPPA
jgi:hypothetical protein